MEKNPILIESNYVKTAESINKPDLQRLSLHESINIVNSLKQGTRNSAATEIKEKLLSIVHKNKGFLIKQYIEMCDHRKFFR